MNTFDTIIRRRSCRQFTGGLIPDEVLYSLIRAGIHAPSSSNSQNYRFLVITDREKIQELSKFKAPKHLTRNATAWIVVFCDTKAHHGYKKEEQDIWEKVWHHNCAAAIQNMLLVATEYKLGSCWIALVKEMNGTRLLSERTWRDIFSDYEIPSHYEPHGLVLLGYPQYKDEDGYPLGDEKHGLNPVKRPHIENFLIREKT